jgi:predicted Rdx family selenoprotein
MKAVFDPVVNEVIKLVKHQISQVKGVDNVVKAVVLVGGFGESRYLQQRIRDAIRPVELMAPLDQ